LSKRCLKIAEREKGWGGVSAWQAGRGRRSFCVCRGRKEPSDSCICTGAWAGFISLPWGGGKRLRCERLSLTGGGNGGEKAFLTGYFSGEKGTCAFRRVPGGRFVVRAVFLGAKKRVRCPLSTSQKVEGGKKPQRRPILLRAFAENIKRGANVLASSSQPGLDNGEEKGKSSQLSEEKKKGGGGSASFCWEGRLCTPAEKGRLRRCPFVVKRRKGGSFYSTRKRRSATRRILSPCTVPDTVP